MSGEGSQSQQLRLEVAARDGDGAARRLADSARLILGAEANDLGPIMRTDLYLVSLPLSVTARDTLMAAVVDEQTQVGSWVLAGGQSTSDQTTGQPTGQPEAPFVEVALRPGVTDPMGDAFAFAGKVLNLPAFEARSGVRFTFTRGTPDAVVRRVTNALLHNDIVDEVAIHAPIVARFSDAVANTLVETVAVRNASPEELAVMNKDRGLALDPAELTAMQSFFIELDRDPTDAEIETIAQTWSEHCSHKTFRAQITWQESGDAVLPLLKQLRASTDSLDKPWVRSAFVDNAGIVAFNATHDLALKVETHNHPSAVEPFGGANTGVGGVIRDVLGVAADPVAVTDILCFGPLDMRADELPAGVLHPQRIREGVVSGIADYGNKMGIPTVAGAIAHQEGFTANPLVFAGCIGLRPAGLVLRGQQPGDRIVVMGGATGRDGIRGATFSSATMDATTGDVAGASVQIGDPIVEKLVADALRDAREQNLFTAITDCGAGGFSSAIGELAAELGADVVLDDAPRKYAGLAPWEMWLSEAQERMVVAVAPDNVDKLRVVCDAHGVAMADLGAFRSDGQLRVRCDGTVIVDLPGSFLHEGRPQRHMVAARPTVPAAVGVRDSVAVLDQAGKYLLAVLAHSDVRSNEDVVRGYDHEIGGATVGRPFVGVHRDGPADAAVVAPLIGAGVPVDSAGGSIGTLAANASDSASRGFAIGIGINVRTGVFDAKRMAEAAIDEAVRNVVAVGGDPDELSLLDNFSWGDPRKPETLGQLVDAVAGCVDGAARFGAPFVSGKDSLNNEYVVSSGERRAIPPTLVITALGIVPNADAVITSDAKSAGNVLVLVGETHNELRGSTLDAVLGVDGGGEVPGADNEAPARYRAVHALMKAGVVRSAHDVSDGGLAVTLAEMCIGGDLGVDAVLPPVRNASGPDVDVAALFGESSGRLVLEVSPTDAETVCARTGGVILGSLDTVPRLRLSAVSAGTTGTTGTGGTTGTAATAESAGTAVTAESVRNATNREVLYVSLADLRSAWRGHVEARGDVHAGDHVQSGDHVQAGGA